MTWVQKAIDQLDRALEWSSLGKMSWRYDEEDSCLTLAPALLEVVGGADDGEAVYPFYSLDVSAFGEVFDEPPTTMWAGMSNELSMEGVIDGNDAWIVFRREPFDDDDAQDVVDPDGGVREKR